MIRQILWPKYIQKLFDVINLSINNHAQSKFGTQVKKTVEIDPILVHAIDPKVTSFGEIAVVFGSFGSKMGEKSIRQSHHPEIMQDHQDESASGQIIIFHTPRFPWNSRGFLETSATFWRPRSVREVAIIWRKSYINSWHGLVFTFHLMIPPPLTLRDLRNGVSPPKINHDNNSDVIKKTDNLQGRGDVISPIFIHFPLYKLVPQFRTGPAWTKACHFVWCFLVLSLRAAVKPLGSPRCQNCTCKARSQVRKSSWPGLEMVGFESSIIFVPSIKTLALKQNMGVSKNRGTPKCMGYNGKPY